MSLPIERRLAALEQRVTPGDRFDVIIQSFVRPGPNGPIEDVPTGYASGWGADARRWHRQPGETLDDLKERAKREAPRGAGGMAVLRECYADYLSD